MVALLFTALLYSTEYTPEPENLKMFKWVVSSLAHRAIRLCLFKVQKVQNTPFTGLSLLKYGQLDAPAIQSKHSIRKSLQFTFLCTQFWINLGEG